jgi:phage terminase small subunit
MFAEEYVRLRCRNATQAAINAGYSRKTAYSQGSRLLKDVEVRESIDRLKTQLRQGLRDEFVFDASTARKTLYGIMTDEGACDRDRIAAAKDLLDRAGLGPPERIELSGELRANPFGGLTEAELRRLARDAPDG